MAPRVSVILPTFNRLEWLPVSVGSICEQTFTDWELVLIDDGSTDGTDAWSRTLRDSRVKVVRQPHTGCIAAARNRGLSESSGDWIAFLDSDDRWWPTKLERQLTQLQAFPESDWCYSNYQLVNRSGTVVPQPAGGPWYPYQGWFVDRILTTEATCITPTLIVRGTTAQRLRFDEDIPLSEDYDFVLRLAETAPGTVVDDVLADVSIHEQRTTRLAGALSGHLGKVITYRKAMRSMTSPRSRDIAKAQFRSHLKTVARIALRHGSITQLVRLAQVLRRI